MAGELAQAQGCAWTRSSPRSWKLPLVTSDHAPYEAPWILSDLFPGST